MKKIFLDCGTHLGKGLTDIFQLHSMDDSWSIYSWEANPETFKSFPVDKFSHMSNLIRFNQAVSTIDGTTEINIHLQNDTEIGEASTIIEIANQHHSEVNDMIYSRKEKIDCIDLSNWLVTNCSKHDFIVLKLDIEGAEYEVLDKLILDSSIDLISEIYIEWHARFFDSKKEYKQRQIKITKILEEKNIKVTPWY